MGETLGWLVPWWMASVWERKPAGSESWTTWKMEPKEERGRAKGTSQASERIVRFVLLLPLVFTVFVSCSFYFVMLALIPFYSWTTHQARLPWSPVSKPYSLTLLGKFLGWMGRMAVHRFTPPAVAASLAFCTSSEVA